MKYPYTDKLEDKRDIIFWFSRYYKEKFGFYLPKKMWGKTAHFINCMQTKGYSLEDIMLVVWGTCNTNDKVKSIWYCKHFFNKIDEFKQLKEKIIETKDVKVYEDIIEKDVPEGDETLEELFDW
ncbi:MAG: hypothetical protein ACOCRK_07230 [bacterium]